MEKIAVKRVAVAAETITIVLVLVMCGLVVPLLLRGQTTVFAQNAQFLIGPMVNCALIVAAIRFKRIWSTLGIVCLPSALAIAGGMFLAIGNIYLLFMVPFIWLGNLALVMTFRYLRIRSARNYITVAACAVVTKALIIFGGFAILFAAGAISPGPAAMMWNTMGVYQLITATVGAFLAFGILYMYARRKKHL